MFISKCIISQEKYKPSEKDQRVLSWIHRGFPGSAEEVGSAAPAPAELALQQAKQWRKGTSANYIRRPQQNLKLREGLSVSSDKGAEKLGSSGQKLCINQKSVALWSVHRRRRWQWWIAMAGTKKGKLFILSCSVSESSTHSRRCDRLIQSPQDLPWQGATARLLHIPCSCAFARREF